MQTRLVLNSQWSPSLYLQCWDISWVPPRLAQFLSSSFIFPSSFYPDILLLISQKKKKDNHHFHFLSLLLDSEVPDDIFNYSLYEFSIVLFLGALMTSSILFHFAFAHHSLPSDFLFYPELAFNCLKGIQGLLRFERREISRPWGALSAWSLIHRLLCQVNGCHVIIGNSPVSSWGCILWWNSPKNFLSSSCLERTLRMCVLRI